MSPSWRAWPAAVLARAETVLAGLEQGEQAGTLARLADDPAALRRRRGAAGQALEPSAVEQALAAISPDELTPKAALEVLYGLKTLLPGR